MKSDVVYTSVRSRRFDDANVPLIINLAPRKICPMDCVYCYGGPTQLKTLQVDEKATFTLDYVKDEIVRAFKWHVKNRTPVTYISFSGFTEPTTYPYFTEVADFFFKVKDRYFQGKQTAVYTNGMMLDKKRIREAVRGSTGAS